MKHLMLLAALLVPITGFAANGELSVFSGLDIKYDRDANFNEIRYHGSELINLYSYSFGWTGYVGNKNTTGIEIFYPYEDWEFGLGVEYSDLDEKVVSTQWKYQVRVEYNINDWLSFGLVHKSNCDYVCTELPLDFLPHGPKGGVNKGYNYLGFRAKIFKF